MVILNYQDTVKSDPLLPGVTSSSVPPVIVCDTRSAITRARRRAIAIDVLQVALVIVVNALFVRWPSVHVPTMTRETSLLLVLALNMAVTAHLWLERAVPRWSARWIASTWCTTERRRFFGRSAS